ncbi:6-carboxyhexanoate--CoA ligase OS=Lysinibacillus sphaericus OX=1421 GN=bioW PE=3 SV=1 [Lysinibacillus sphaericus]
MRAAEKNLEGGKSIYLVGTIGSEFQIEPIVKQLLNKQELLARRC